MQTQDGSVSVCWYLRVLTSLPMMSILCCTWGTHWRTMANSSGMVVQGSMRISKHAGSFGSKKVNAGETGIRENLEANPVKDKKTINNYKISRKGNKGKTKKLGEYKMEDALTIEEQKKVKTNWESKKNKSFQLTVPRLFCNHYQIRCNLWALQFLFLPTPQSEFWGRFHFTD